MANTFDKDTPLDFEEAPENFNCSAHSVNYPVKVLVDMLSTGKLIIPNFQRKFSWGRKYQQSFLRSVITGIPLTNIMIVSDPSDPESSLNVLDGFQRLSSLTMFLNGKIHLGKGAKYNKLKFDQLPETVKSKLAQKEVQVTKVVTDELFWPYLFRTYNKGGLPLNSIELRRAQFKIDIGYALENIAENNNEFIALFGKNSRFKGLHVLLRAVAMHKMYKIYQKPLEQFLDTFCTRAAKDVKFAAELESIPDKLNFIIKAIYSHPDLGVQTFHLAELKPVNLGLLDCILHAGLLLMEQDPKISKQDLGLKLSKLRTKIVTDNFAMTIALTQDTSGRESVQQRMSLTEEYLEE